MPRVGPERHDGSRRSSGHADEEPFLFDEVVVLFRRRNVGKTFWFKDEYEGYGGNYFLPIEHPTYLM